MLRFLSRWLIEIGALAIVALVAVITWQVFGRFVLDASPSWTEQAALVIMLWLVMLGAAAGVEEGFHIRIALAESLLGPQRAAWLRRLSAAIVALLGLVIAFGGAILCWTFRDSAVPSLGISRGVALSVIPVSGVLIAVFACRRLADPLADDVEAGD